MLLSVAFMIAVNSIDLFAQSLDEVLVGTWLMESNGEGLIGGDLVFTENGKYQFEKTFPGDTRATESGCFRLDTRDDPAKLILCLGDCGGVGSEWTTCYCLARLDKVGRLEILISPDSNFPKKFPKDKTSRGYFVFIKTQ